MVTSLEAAQPSDLIRRTAIAIGGSSGLGLLSSDALAAKGAKVVVAARREARLDEIVASLQNGSRAG